MKELIKKYGETVKTYGKWTAHNICLGEGIYTLGNKITRDEYKLRRIVQIVQDSVDGDLAGLRILDLACLEGLYAVEFAMRGAEVVAIEGRKQHVEKVKFAAEALNLKRLTVYQDDVRNLGLEKYGAFDVILCLGILYHIDASSVFPLIDAMYACCKNMLIIDTHIAMFRRNYVDYNGQRFWGINYYEYSPNLSAEKKEHAIWASLDNPDSFWPTERSLFNALSYAGFTSAYECQNPPEALKERDRITILAKKGERAFLRCNPQLNENPVEEWSEKINNKIHPYQYRYRLYFRRLIDCLPSSVKNICKRLLFWTCT